MIKKMFFILGLIGLILLSSCENVISNANYGINKNFSISLGKDVSDTISRAVTSNESITLDTILQVECTLLRGTDTVVLHETKDIAIKDLFNASFKLKNILSGNNYRVSIKFSYNNILIYEALSSVLELNNNELNISLDLVQHNSAIKYELNGGEFTSGQRKPLNYFINSNITIPSPKKDGFKFDGWYLSRDYNQDEKITVLGEKKFLGDITLYAKWVKHDNVAAVESNPLSLKFDVGDTITLTTPTKDAVIYYTLNDSTPNKNSTHAISPVSITITEDMVNNDKVTITAFASKQGMTDSEIKKIEYSRNRYSIVFNKNNHGIENCDTIPNLKKNDTITLPSLSEMKMNFMGWKIGENTYKPSEKPFKIILDDKLIALAEKNEIILYAVWEDVVNPVTFTPTSVKIDVADTITLSSIEGSTIYYTTDGSTPNKNSTHAISPVSITITEDMVNNDKVTITAFASKQGMTDSEIKKIEYSRNRYSIVFNKNNHGIENCDTIPNLKKNDTITLPSLSEEKMNFMGWKIGENTYKPSEKLTLNDKLIALTEKNEIILYAVWEGVVNPVTFTPTSEKIDAEDTITLSSIEGSTIYYTTDGTEPSLSSKNAPSPLSITITENMLAKTDSVMIKAFATKQGMTNSSITQKEYTRNKYTVTFDNNKLGTKPTDISSIVKGSKITEPPIMNANGYFFVGWYTTKEFTDGSKWDFKTNTVSSSITLYAKWDEFTVKFDKSTGKYDFGEKINISCTLPGTNIYYTTDDTEPTENSTLYEKNSNLTVDTTFTLKAVGIKDGIKTPVASSTYTMKTYTIKFDHNNHGTKPNDLTNVKKGGLLQSPSPLTETGYTFGGWYSNSDLNENSKWNFDNPYTDTSITTLYAKWTPILYSITYEVGTTGATNENTVENYNIESKEIILTPPKKTDYIGRWMCDGKEITSIPTGSTGDITLVAQVEQGWTITYEGADRGNNPATYNNSNQGFRLDPPPLKKEGYKPVWLDDKGNACSYIYSNTTGNIVLTANLTPISYKVCFIKNGGIGPSPAVMNCKYATDYTFPNPTELTKTDYIFDGWKTADGKTVYKANDVLKNLTTQSDDIVKLYANWTLGPVTGKIAGLDYVVAQDGTSIEFSWTNPSDSDIENVLIEYDNGKQQRALVKGKQNQKSTCTVNGTNKGAVYNFKFTLENATKQKIGTSVTKQISVYKISEAPTILNQYTSPHPPIKDPQTSYGNKWIYVEFGMYPKTQISDTTLVYPDPIDPSPFLNKQCYYGKDGYYYIEESSSTSYRHDDTPFKNGEPIIPDTKYYFRLEPLVWRVLDKNYTDKKNQTGVLLLCEELLYITNFQYSNIDYGMRDIDGKQIACNNYEHSKHRAITNGISYLDSGNRTNKDFENKGILQTAFTSEAQKYIKEVTLDNSEASTFPCGDSVQTNDYACNDTLDKVFILSQNEFTNSSYGFEAYSVEDTARVYPSSNSIPDYVKAICSQNFSDIDISSRSPSPKKYNHSSANTLEEKGLYHFVVTPTGSIDNNYLNYDSAIAPAIVINQLPSK